MDKRILLSTLYTASWYRTKFMILKRLSQLERRESPMALSTFLWVILFVSRSIGHIIVHITLNAYKTLKQNFWKATKRNWNEYSYRNPYLISTRYPSDDDACNETNTNQGFHFCMESSWSDCFCWRNTNLNTECLPRVVWLAITGCLKLQPETQPSNPVFWEHFLQHTSLKKYTNFIDAFYQGNKAQNVRTEYFTF